jgi:hypothetical protein
LGAHLLSLGELPHYRCWVSFACLFAAGDDVERHEVQSKLDFTSMFDELCSAVSATCYKKNPSHTGPLQFV